jgi:zinc transport system substrate-binding protein
MIQGSIFFSIMRRSIIILLLLGGAGVFVGCSSDLAGGEDQQGSKMIVIATIYPIQYFAERIGGGRVRVVGVYREGVDPHVAELTAHDLAQIAKADLVLSNGLGMEPSFQKALKASGPEFEGRIVEVTVGNLATQWRSNGHGGNERGLDPHFWLDPILAIEQANIMTDAIISIDPTNENYYAEAFLDLKEDLLDLDHGFRIGLSECTRNSFVVSHAALGYLATRYGLVQTNIAGLTHGMSPSAGRLAELADIIDREKIKAILVEPLHQDGSVSETLSRETGAMILDIHPLGAVTSKELDEHDDYFGLMRDNLRSLRVALECNG